MLSLPTVGNENLTKILSKVHRCLDRVEDICELIISHPEIFINKYYLAFWNMDNGPELQRGTFRGGLSYIFYDFVTEEFLYENPTLTSVALFDFYDMLSELGPGDILKEYDKEAVLQKMEELGRSSSSLFYIDEISKIGLSLDLELFKSKIRALIEELVSQRLELLTTELVRGDSLNTVDLIHLLSKSVDESLPGDELWRTFDYLQEILAVSYNSGRIHLVKGFNTVKRQDTLVATLKQMGVTLFGRDKTSLTEVGERSLGQLFELLKTEDGNRRYKDKIKKAIELDDLQEYALSRVLQDLDYYLSEKYNLC